MAFYDSLFNAFGLREWCDASAGSAKMTMASLLAKTNPDAADEGPVFPFPSMDELYKACPSFPQSREFTAGVEEVFLNVKDVLKTVLDPLTQPLSWLLEGALFIFLAAPWWIVVPLILMFVWYVCRSVAVTTFVTVSFAFLAFIDHLDAALQTLAIIAVCTGICIMLGVPVGIAMAKSNRFQRSLLPLLDLLQTLPTFVYLIPLIFLFSVTEPKLYGIAIIVYAIVPVIRLTDLGIRLVDQDVVEAANAFGMSSRQKLLGIELPLALPNLSLIHI